LQFDSLIPLRDVVPAQAQAFWQKLLWQQSVWHNTQHYRLCWQIGLVRRIKNMATYAHSIGLQVNAGHGLTLENTRVIAQLPEIVELNIGHSIIARAVFVGLEALSCAQTSVILEI
jgi:pyridoxine 5'-phosphate synthase PdxJ